ncbi:unnamed protein product [Rodentolepis nana]|uniref:Serine/threonine-protein phosphatase n=1 Tax=Rodentolepis nana TaxID=102285 RepID=A0A0R3SZW4_RODNA|nr:unnamed protein product [Rodentolepis nana]
MSDLELNISRKQVLKKVDHLIERLEDYQVLKGEYAKLSEVELTQLYSVMQDIFLEDNIVIDLDLSTPLYIIGDIFGQFGDLLRMFKLMGNPPERRYLFLGNYINRGDRSTETLTYLYCLKLKFPKHIYLLRGNHECQHVSENYGFYNECIARFTGKLWQPIVRTFDHLPLIAIIEEKIFCCHSGMSPNIQRKGISSLQEFRDYLEKTISRPTEIDTNVLMTHYTWSNPDPDIEDWDENPAGLGYLYGPSVVNEFCERLGIQQIIRSNEYFEKGFDYSFEGKILTIFSAPNYLGTFNNNGAIVEMNKHPITQEIKYHIKIIEPIMELRTKKTGQMNIAIKYADEIEEELDANFLQDDPVKIAEQTMPIN